MLFYSSHNRREFRNLITAVLAAPSDNNVSTARYGGIHQKLQPQPFPVTHFVIKMCHR